MRNYYEVLGVRPDAAPEEIKRAYKDLARRDHPDRNAGSQASEDAFKELAAAYAVLSDPGARVLYDVYGAGDVAAPPQMGAAAAWVRPAPSTATLDQNPAPLYLTRTEMAAGCTKVLPVPCPGCAGHGRGIGQSCEACGGRGWSPTGAMVRVDVPTGARAGDALWGEVVGGHADPVLYAVRIRREARSRPADGTGAGSGPARRTNGVAPAARAGEPAFRFHAASLSRRENGTGPGLAARIGSTRDHLRAGADWIADRARSTVRGLAQPVIYPVAVQLAAVARGLASVGERQVQLLTQLERRFATDIARMGATVPAAPPPAPAPPRVAELVVQRDAGLRLAAFALVGAVVVSVLTAWMIAATIGEIGAAAGLPGPLAALHGGWVAGIGIVSLALVAGIARRLLASLKSEEILGFLVENVPSLLFVLLAAIGASIFWHAAPGWLQRLGVASRGTALEALPRYGVAAAGPLLILLLYALGDWLTVGVESMLGLRAKLRAEVLLSDRARALESARALAARLADDVRAARAAADGLGQGVRQDFERAAGMPVGDSVAAGIDDMVRGLVERGTRAPSPLPMRGTVEALAHFAIDLLVFSIWAAAMALAAASLMPALESLPSTASPAFAFVAALALPLAASMCGLLVKESLDAASQAALAQRVVPWLGRRPMLVAAGSTILALALLAAWAAGSSPEGGLLTAAWAGGTVLATAMAGIHLDAALVAAVRLVLLSVLSFSWLAMRSLAGCAGAVATLCGAEKVEKGTPAPEGFDEPALRFGRP